MMSEGTFEIDIDCTLTNIVEKSASAPSSPNERSSVLRELANIGGHVKGRRVTFPDDETIVTGYFEAPDPWSEEYPTSTDNIVSAYRAACWKQGVKPLQRVLQQIQIAHESSENSFELNLKGENLDAHNCEALEEVFKRLQFRSLLLENSNLDDEGAAAIFDMIEYYDTTSYLDISCNKSIGNQGWQACSKMLKRTPGLQYLDASKTSQNEQSLLILGRAFRTGCFLHTLHLENSGINGRPLVILIAALKLNNTLIELFLGENKICSADGLQLGNLLRSNSTLELLDLKSNNLQDLGICHLVDGLCQQAANCGECLKSLSLAHNNLSQNGMAHINRALLVSESLSILDLSQNNISDEGIQYMKQGLLTNQSLQHLILVNSKITCEGTVALAEFIADNQHIAQMDLRGNDIKLAGLMALSLSMKHNQSMVHLKLDQYLNTKVTPDEMSDEQKLLDEISQYCQRNKSQIEAERFQEKNVNFVVQSSNVPTIHNEAELTALLQEKAAQRTSNLNNGGMISSATFPGDSIGHPKNRFQVCRVFLETEKTAPTPPSSSSRGSEESVFFTSEDENSSHLTKEETRKNYIRHQDSLAIHKQRSSSGHGTATDEDLYEVLDDVDENDITDINSQSSQKVENTSNSNLMARRSSGNKVKKLTFILPDGYTEHVNGTMKNNRRMSTPALSSQRLMQHKHKSLDLKLGRQLEGLDLRSSIPLSPTRLREGLVLFPEPLDVKISTNPNS